MTIDATWRRLAGPLPFFLFLVSVGASSIRGDDTPIRTHTIAEAEPVTDDIDVVRPNRAPRNLDAVRVAEPPTIDGRLNDEAWEQAPVGGNLYQYRPNVGVPMSERTEFRVVYTDDFLYFAIWCYDSEPDKITARIMSRDGKISADDWVVVVIDPFLDRRNGYFFQVNPNGARRDQLVSDNVNANENWDGVWLAAATRDEEGWKVEIAIPFKTISFNPNTETWGLNIARRIKRKAENGRWSNAVPEILTYNVAEAGQLHGLRGLKQGLGLELKPYALVEYTSNRDVPDDTVEFDGGGDVRYQVTPNFTTRLSYNTDFAETEVDQRQVNLTRFPLLFPEKRSFFLEDSGIFQFGGLPDGDTSSSSSSIADVTTQLIPFFSRRIGLSDDGEIVPITVAGKATGRIDNYNVGVVDAVLEDHDNLGTKNAFVGRASRNIFEQSSIGLLTTIGDPNSNDANAVVGSDVAYRTTSLFDDQILQVNAFGLGSYTESEHDDMEPAYGASVEMPNDHYRARVGYKEIASGFDPALGFVSRDGVRGYDTVVTYRPRVESVDAIHRIIVKYNNEYVTNLDNELETSKHEFRPIHLWFTSNDEAKIEINYDTDSPQEPFEIGDGVIIPPGDYDWYSYDFGIDSASKRLLRTTFEYKLGNFYTGTRQRYKAAIVLLPWKHLNFKTQYTLNQVRLPQGDFDTRLAAVRMDWNFNPDLSWFHFLQYDNDSEAIGYNSRIQWEFNPGQTFFIVLNQNVSRNDSRLRLVESVLTTKIGLTMRF